jgi:hypothetical protein
MGHYYPIAIFLILLFQTSLLDWESWKNKVKTGAGPLKGPPWGAKKRQKSVMQWRHKGLAGRLFSQFCDPH